MGNFSKGARSRARELALQALYQAEITGHGKAELLSQFHERTGYDDVDQTYFDELLSSICDDKARLLDSLSVYADRPIQQLDPVELAILLIGCYELEARPEVPYRAVINEAVNLAKRFGAEDGHKYVNAVLDRALRTVRADKPA